MGTIMDVWSLFFTGAGADAKAGEDALSGKGLRTVRGAGAGEGLGEVAAVDR